jgi:hypothetical protein
MKVTRVALIATGLLAFYAAGYATGTSFDAPSPSVADLARAQVVNNKYLPPIWADQFRETPHLKRLRDQGYLSCYDADQFDLDCGREQDEAVQNVSLALMVAKAQSEMQDQRRLTPKEREVAGDPILRSKVVRYCWKLYQSHGGRDARVLAVCLGNLTEFSPLVPIPVS